MSSPIKDSPKEPAKQAPATAPPKKRSYGMWLATGIFIFIGLVWFFVWFFYYRYYQYTDDSYVNGNMININSAISGNVIAFCADDTDLVVQGQELVVLDATKYQVDYDKELAFLASTVLEVRQLYDDVHVNEMNVEIKKIAFSKSRYDHDNRSALVSSQAVSNEDFIHSKDDLSMAEYQLKQAEDQLQMAKDAAGNTPLVTHPKIEHQKNNVREAYYNLKHCRVYAPATGYVAQRNVNVGQWVNPTTNMMVVIPIDYIWVDANYKETQLTDMRIGQPVEVWLDIYGSKAKYSGKVLGIASGSGSVFSLIPPQNATGNWIKIVQRLPVRVSLDPETLKKFPPRLGLSAEVNVDISNLNLPLLAKVPASKPVANTNVYDLDFSEVNQKIEQVIQENLNK
jgi:membrane fusion protein, multidrug efflux system